VINNKAARDKVGTEDPESSSDSKPNPSMWSSIKRRRVKRKPLVAEGTQEAQGTE